MNLKDTFSRKTPYGILLVSWWIVQHVLLALVP